jgi:vacuolar-type H+-ATPase subunit D/Vma8
MAAVASERTSTPQLEAKNAEDLLQRLDDLLEQYLNTLDEYQKARERLSANLSAGHMSLAQANFSNTTGRRYGQDHYDERMQAQRIISVSCLRGDQEPPFRFESAENAKTEQGETGKEKTEKEAKCNPKTKDPLKWFGVLVPQPLRSAQASFTSAVETSIPDLLNVQQQLRHLEIEIGRTRKSLKKLGKV